MGFHSLNRRFTNDRVRSIQTGLEKGDCVDDLLNGFRSQTNIPDRFQVSVSLEAGSFNLTRYLLFEIDGQKYTYVPRRGVLLPALTHLLERNRD